MHDEQNEKGQPCQRNKSTTKRWRELTVGLTFLLIVPMTPRSVNAMGHLIAPASSNLEITCSNPVMKSAPRFLSVPKGSAKYPFTSYCTSPSVPGAMTLRWEGSWTPSETRPDRPNASESITVTSYDGFIPGREPGGKIFLYWTGRCDRDPWLQPSTCDRFGGYVPPDVREALYQIDHERFPLTWKSISPSLKQQLVKDYQQAQILAQRASQQVSLSSDTPQHLQAMKSQPQQSQAMSTQRQQTQAMTVQPQATLPRPGLVEKPSTNLRLFSRGTDAPEQGPQEDAAIENLSSVASPSEGMNDEPAIPQVVVTFDQPVHFMSAKGEDTLIAAGVYEIEPVLDLQLSLAREGEVAVLLPATQERHSEALQQPMALLVQGESNDERHLVLLTPNGKRLDTVGSLAGMRSRGTNMVVELPDKILKDAITQASAQPASKPLPPCQQNPIPSGPRWLPVPCTMPSIQETPTIPVP